MNWYVYRLPGQKMVHGGWSDRLITGRTDEHGFVIAPFDGDANMTITIPGDNDLDQTIIAGSPMSGGLYMFPERSTTRDEHRLMVNEIVAEIEAGRLDKCVAARAIVEVGEVDLMATFDELCNKLHGAFVFCFHTPVTGTWIGASPEVLLFRGANMYLSNALAGTRPAGSTGPWDHKNIEEHQVVIDYIESTLREAGLQPTVGELGTIEAGPVEHLITKIKAFDTPGVTGGIRGLAARLSPTPALSGLPRDKAIEIINRHEPFNRAYYGGYCGVVLESGNGLFFVNLRSMWVEKDRYCIFVGGGIMEESTPESEWEETEQKAKTIRNNIKYKQP